MAYLRAVVNYDYYNESIEFGGLYFMTKLQKQLYVIINYSNTKPGKYFDLALIYIILASLIVLMLDSVDTIRQVYGSYLLASEWVITVLFTFEYFTRIYITNKKKRYIFSFFGLVDLLSILPTYISLFFPGLEALGIIRLFRVIRVFRVLKLAKFIFEAQHFVDVFKASRQKITIFLMSVLILVFVLGSLMYLIEGPENGFTSIPKSVYWAIVTLTTVGYGDITPKTILGQLISSIVMIIGYSIIAIPTGLVSLGIKDSIDKN